MDKENYDIIGQCENQKRIYKATTGLLNNLVNASTNHTESFFKVLWENAGWYFTKEQSEENKYIITLRRYNLYKGYLYNTFDYDIEKVFVWVKYDEGDKKESVKDKVNSDIKKGLVVKNKK